MGKDKLKRWTENKTFSHVYEPELHNIAKGATFMRGEWRGKVFHNSHPIVLELGCGKGEYSVGLARLFPEKNFIGVDIKGHRFWRGAKTVEEEGLENVVFLRTRIELIERFFAAGEVDEIWLTFSDPQLKDGRDKKRLTGPQFIDRYRNLCKSEALIHVKTDNTFFYQWSLESMPTSNVNILEHTNDVYGAFFESKSKLEQKVLSIQTFYEEKFAEQGEKIKYIRARL